MATPRFIPGQRDGDNKESLAREILKIEKEKGGKLTSEERFKMIMKRKMEANKKKVQSDKNGHFSPKAQQALKQIAAKKAAKEAKALRHSVIVQPRKLHNGQITKKGYIRDISGAQIGKINVKNGKMAMYNGVPLGQYAPKNRRVESVITGAIDKYSPYYINLRKMQAMQAAGIDPHTGQPLNQHVINVHGNRIATSNGSYGSGDGGMASQMFHDQQQKQAEDMMRAQQNEMYNPNFNDATGNRNISGTAWGAMSNNVWGTYSDNVWGMAADNVWGGYATDVWGGVGGSPWGQGRAIQIWGTGNGVNHLRKIGNMLRKLFGRPHKKTLEAYKKYAQSAPRQTARAPSRRPAGAPARRR